MREAKSFCRLCFGRCSLRVIVEGERIVKVEKDPEPLPGREGICPKGLALPELLYHPDRLKYPLKRAGERGEGKWKRISWDEALNIVGSKSGELKAKFGPESVVIGLGQPRGLELAFAHRLASTFGTPNVVTPGHICHVPGEIATTYTFGSGCYADPDGLPKCMVLWGNNLPQTFSGSLSLSQFRSALDNGAKLIVIDPRKTSLTSQADIWLAPRPGSDGALALGLLKVILQEKLYEEEFVHQWTLGFEKLQEHLQGYSLEEIAELTWISPEQMEKTARLYAKTKPAVIQWGNALDHTTNSFQSFRAICILKAITGNLDIPGGEIVPERLPMARPGHFMLLPQFPRRPEQMIGGEFKLLARSATIPRQSVVRAVLEEKPYPVKGMLLFGTNPLLTYPDAERTYQSLLKLEFLAVAELFMTPTAALADVVLPVAANLEFDEVAPYPPFGGFALAYPKIVEPPEECWPDYKIINQLGRQLGMSEYFWEDEKEALDFILQASGMTFEEFKQRRVLQVKAEAKRYERKGFSTPSGKVEIYCQRLEEMGYNPLPYYAETAEVSSQEYPLLLTNAKLLAFYHSTGRNIATLRKLCPNPLVELNPATAVSLGLGEGDWVYIETKKGRIKQQLSLNDSLDPRVVVAAYGWWFPEEGPSGLYGWRESNLNILTQSEPPYEPALGSLNLRGIPCRVSKS